MVVRMIKWRPWMPLMYKKFEAKLVVRKLKGFCWVPAEGDKSPSGVPRLMVEIRWKGPKIALSALRRKVKRNFTKEEEVRSDGIVEWNEEFQSICNLSAYKENMFHPWEITFTVLNGSKQGPKNKIPIVGTASLNLGEYVSAAEEKELKVNIPLTLSGGGDEFHPSFCLSLSLLELRTSQEPLERVQTSIMPVPLSPCFREGLSTDKDDLSALRAGLRKVKIFTEYVSIQKSKKACREEEGSDGRCSTRSEDAEYTYPFDTDSFDDSDEGELEEGFEGKKDSSVRKSFSYGTLAYANCVGEPFYSKMVINGDGEDWIYYSNSKSDVGSLRVDDSTASVSVHSLLWSSKLNILSWRKRKLSFRTPKAKGEPLLKKTYGEEGGDDIDFDRRQLSSSDESFGLEQCKMNEDLAPNHLSVSEFGDDNFSVGCWEHMEVVSRDRHMKLQTQVFFASIDQRSEQVAGGSACTALVAVIADWLQNNQHAMLKSQFDILIREGSLEWRTLCENETYRQRFPDKHFDLETILQAKIRPLALAPEKSFIGFFHPEGMVEGDFDFLHGAMSFDSIWDEVSHAGSHNQSKDDPQVYIVSWNDHFFILKVEPDAYYIIDTLGERLYEGCSQAYILKFDRDTIIHTLPNGAQSFDQNPADDQQNGAAVLSSKNQQVQLNDLPGAPVDRMLLTKPEEQGSSEREEEIVCRGKECCKEYIKNFLAAIPIRELMVDIKKGLMTSTPLHHRLQIEFHYTLILQPMLESPAVEANETTLTMVAVAVAN